MDRALEQEHLRKAETGIAQARDRIARQHKLIETMRSRGHEDGTAQSFLETMCQTLAVMEEHRLLILKELDGDTRF